MIRNIPFSFSRIFSKTSHPTSSLSGTSSFVSSRQHKKVSKSLIIFLGVFALILVPSIFFLTTTLTKSQIPSAPNTNGQVQLPPPYASQKLNKSFTFSLKNSSGVEVTKFSYEITSADLTNQIIVQGQKATAIAGRTFLILNLALDNSYKQGITVNTKDYIRLMVNGDKTQLLAPDIHNDPVQVQAISTKYTRVGFPINTSDKDLTLQIGEIDGVKQTIKLEIHGK